ncbi:MAG: DUF72 domain-containing protein [Proteobacteria bacterium]|nr:DUF72 domain-containing protein [Pseudomonadota bacterium]
MALYVGTSGWTYKDWDGLFYPQGVRGADRLSFYAERFDTVEVNATFYRFPTQNAINAWNTRLPEHFHLVVKGHRSITHFRKLVDCDEVLEAFLERVSPLRRLKVILWQLPPSLEQDLGRLEKFLKLLPPDGPRHAIEFRHASWWDDDTAALLARHRAAFVAVSHPKMPADIIPTTGFLYVRWHGLGEELYRYDYSTEKLSAWADRLRPHMSDRTLYAFFNNDYDGRAINNAQTLRGMLSI